MTGHAVIEGLYTAVNLYYNYTGSTTCLDIDTTATGQLDTHGWDFQVSVHCSSVFEVENFSC